MLQFSFIRFSGWDIILIGRVNTYLYFLIDTDRKWIGLEMDFALITKIN